ESMRINRFLVPFVITVTSCTAGVPGSTVPAGTSEAMRLPTGARLDPAGRSFDVGSMPLAIALSPDDKSVVILLNGWREQGIQVLDRGTGKVVQDLLQSAAFLGL